MALPFNAYISSEGGTLIRLVFLYENKWSLSQCAAKLIDSCERKILRRIYGPV